MPPTNRGSEDLVRVLRVVEYTGPRSAVEKAVSMSVHGERRYGPRGSEITVRAATIGEYPEILGSVADVATEAREPGRRKGHFLIIGANTGVAIGCLSNPTSEDMDNAQHEDPGCTFREVDALDCPVCKETE